jgi:serine-type D-Ala-D-Ala carboxypeptidase/endopeptidase (penicillin-binding protein 4)
MQLAEALGLPGKAWRVRAAARSGGRLRQRRPCAAVLVFALALAAHGGSAADEGKPVDALPPPVANAARSLGVPESAISLWVQDVGAPGPRQTFRADEPRNPASTLKVVTTWAALERLGPAYTWQTAIHLDGPLRPGGVARELWIRGAGDPYLVVEEYWKLLAALRDRGLTRIEEGLVFDLSHFELPPEDPGAFDNQRDRVYNMIPHPLLVNFNAVRFRVLASGEVVRVNPEPPLPNLRIDNRLKPGGGACGGYQMGVAISVAGAPAQDRAVLDGRFPVACREYELSRTVLQPETYAYGLFELYWRMMGGELAGGWRTGVLPNGSGRPFHVHRSRSLGELIRLVNKYSNNVMTRHLELTLGAEMYGAPATPEKGTQAILDVLAQRGIDTEGVVIANSAGLSRDSRISARQLGAVLSAAWESPFMPEFVSSLALSGLDGTTRSRFRGTPAAGRMHLKTGRLDEVSAIAGYVTAQSGRRVIAVLIVNARDAHRGPGEQLQNAFLQWVHETG